eukprot:scaffold1839_cov382-Prasinococcus_capsulatus_cf.AAC.6
MDMTTNGRSSGTPLKRGPQEKGGLFVQISLPRQDLPPGHWGYPQKGREKSQVRAPQRPLASSARAPGKIGPGESA